MLSMLKTILFVCFDWPLLTRHQLYFSVMNSFEQFTCEKETNNSLHRSASLSVGNLLLYVFPHQESSFHPLCQTAFPFKIFHYRVVNICSSLELLNTEVDYHKTIAMIRLILPILLNLNSWNMSVLWMCFSKLFHFNSAFLPVFLRDSKKFAKVSKEYYFLYNIFSYQ